MMSSLFLWIRPVLSLLPPRTSTCLLLIVVLVVGNDFLVVTGKVIDLSHKHGPNTPTPLGTAPPYNRTSLIKGDFFGVFLDSGWYSSTEHMGTHMDVPNHFYEGAQSLDEIPIELSVTDGVMIDVSEEVQDNKSYVLTKERILAWEKTYGKIPRKAAVLVRFGWDVKFMTSTDYLGTANIEDVLTYVYPYISPEAGLWLHTERDMLYIGTDTASPDPYGIEGQPSGFPIHLAILKDNRYIVENMKGLGQLPARDFRFVCAPVKYVGATGAQVRAFAMTPDETNNLAPALAICMGNCIICLLLFYISVLGVSW